MASIAVGLALCALSFGAGYAAQTAGSLQRVKSVYVGSFGDKPGAAELRASLIADLRKSHKLKLVESPAEADAVLSGGGETWIRGYYSLNPRVRTDTADAHPIYGGYLSAELKGSHEEVLWSYLVTPKRFGPEEIERNLAGQMLKRMLAALDQPPTK